MPCSLGVRQRSRRIDPRRQPAAHTCSNLRGVASARGRDTRFVAGGVALHDPPRRARRPSCEQRAQPARTHHRKRRRARPRTASVLGVGLGVAAHRSAPSWATGSTRSCERDGDVPIGDHVVAAVEVGKRAGDPAHSVQPTARQAARLELAAEERGRTATQRRELVEPATRRSSAFASTPRDRATARASATRAATVAEHSPDRRPHELVDARPHDRHPQVEAIDERAGDTADVAVSRRLAARARARRTTLAARTGVHRGDEQHLRGERDARLCRDSPARRPLRAADGARRAPAR